MAPLAMMKVFSLAPPSEMSERLCGENGYPQRLCLVTNQQVKCF
jgi:hypothetical protein